MKILIKIRFAIDMIIENKINFIVSVLLGGIGCLLLGFTFLIYLSANYGKESANQVLSQGIDHTGIIEVEDFYLEAATQFRKEAINSKVIDSIGALSYVGVENDTFSELYDIQYGHGINDSSFISGEYLQMLLVDREALSACNLTYEKGVMPEELVFSNENIQYLYLGFAYHDIPIGTQFKVIIEGNETIYEVAGILKKDTKYVSQDLLFGVDFTTLTSCINMNYEIICINNEFSMFSPWMFSVEKDYSMEEGLEELNRIAETYGVIIRGYSLQEVFNNVEAETHVMQESLQEMLLLLLGVILIVVTTLQIVEIYRHAHSYGVLYSVGFLTPEILIMMIIRNVIYLVSSFCLGTGLLVLTGNKYFITNVQVKQMFFQLLCCRVLPLGIFLMIVLFFIITFIPCFLFYKMDPVKLMQGE